MFYFFLFIIGTILGSFWSVLTGRLWEFTLNDVFFGTKATKQKFFRALHGVLVWRSACPKCHHTLGAQDLVPVASYLSTHGKCRYCHTKISPRYRLLEIWCGLLFAWLWYILIETIIPGHSRTQLFSLSTKGTIHIALRFIVTRLLYLLFVHDMETMYLHDILWLLSCITIIWLLITAPQNTGTIWAITAWWFLLFFITIYWLAKIYVRIKYKENAEWFGMWDVRLSPIVGAVFGLWEVFIYWPTFSRFTTTTHFFYYIITACIIGLIYATIHKLLYPKSSIHRIPFFPGMIIALWIMMVWVRFFI